MYISIFELFTLIKKEKANHLITALHPKTENLKAQKKRQTFKSEYVYHSNSAALRSQHDSFPTVRPILLRIQLYPPHEVRQTILL